MLETAGVHLVVVARVQPEPHHLQVLNEGFLRWINTFNRQETIWVFYKLTEHRDCGFPGVCVRRSTFTFGVEESKQLSAQLSVGHCLFEKGVLFRQLLGAEVLRLPGHPVVVVQQCQQSSVGGSGEQSVLIQVSEQAGGGA